MKTADKNTFRSMEAEAPVPEALSDTALFGLDDTTLAACPRGGQVHPALLPPLAQLSEAASAVGFSLAVASGFRSFERQLAIWNAKAAGERPLLDRDGQPLDPTRLPASDRLHAILRWSALPGASRHHWGTDIDVYDRAGLPPGQRVQLTREETLPGGPFAAFHRWLTDFLASADNPGFYRPYDRDRGGVSPEPWHLSYAPLANRYASALTVERLARFLEAVSVDDQGPPLALEPVVMAQLPALYERYVRVPMGPDGTAVPDRGGAV